MHYRILVILHRGIGEFSSHWKVQFRNSPHSRWVNCRIPLTLQMGIPEFSSHSTCEFPNSPHSARVNSIIFLTLEREIPEFSSHWKSELPNSPHTRRINSELPLALDTRTQRGELASQATASDCESRAWGRTLTHPADLEHDVHHDREHHRPQEQYRAHALLKTQSQCFSTRLHLQSHPRPNLLQAPPKRSGCNKSGCNPRPP